MSLALLAPELDRDGKGGKVFMSRRTRDTQVVTSPVAVGRFVVDALKAGARPETYYKLVSGCTPASLNQL